MEKASHDMDFDGWEILPEDEFFRGKRLFSREPEADPKGTVDMSYLICPSPINIPCGLEPPEMLSIPIGLKRLVPVPIQLEPMVEKQPDDHEFVKDISEVTNVRTIGGTPSIHAEERIKDPNLAMDHDFISRVLFKKMRENETFVDMKLDSLTSGGRGLKPQIDLGAIQFEEKEDAFDSGEFNDKPTQAAAGEAESELKKKGGCWKGCGFNIWGWRVSGIGALCTAGAAAAAICIFIFSSHQRQKHHQYQNKKLQFQIYADDKSINEAVHPATRINQAIPTVRVGIPLTRTQVACEGN